MTSNNYFRSRSSALLLIVVLLLIGTAFGPTLLPALASPGSAIVPVNTASTADPDRIADTSTDATRNTAQGTPTRTGPSGVDGLLARIGEAVLKKLPGFVDHLNRGGKLKIVTPMAFYDARLHRIFVSFKGSVEFTGRIARSIDFQDRVLTSEGNFAWDLTIDHVKKTDRAITFDFEGDVVVFLDKVLISVVDTTVDTVGGLMFRAAGDQVLAFLKVVNANLVAEGITKTLTSFSKEALSNSATEVAQNALRTDNQKIAALVRAGLKSGGLVDFFCVSILHSVLSGTVGFAGATMGAAVGNALVPGVGGFVGALLGQKITGAIASTIVNKVTVEIPMSIAIKRICKYGAVLKQSPEDQVAREKMASSENFITKRLKREFDDTSFKTLDKIVHHIDGLDAADRLYMTSLIWQIKDLLQFKINQQGDWYGAKKYYELKTNCAKWGVAF